MTAFPDLDRFQEEQATWSERNFGPKEVWASSRPLRGVVEEVGELQEVQEGEIAAVLERQAVLNKVWMTVGRLCHFDLKGEQGIRYTPEQIEAKKMDAVGDILIYLVDYCTTSGLSMGEALQLAWAEVQKRDWVANPMDAAQQVRAELDDSISLTNADREEEGSSGIIGTGLEEAVLDLPTPEEAEAEIEHFADRTDLVDPLPEGAAFVAEDKIGEAEITPRQQ